MLKYNDRGTSLKRKTLTLVVTQSCNLDCTYCYQLHKSKNIMSLDIAKSAINKHIRKSKDFDEFEIDLFGGEPFIKPEFIIELCEWTWKQNYNVPMIFFASTNGTLVHGQIQEWLKKYKHLICLGLSLDGTPETHNKNRNNSYSKIDINFFLETYPFQPIQMTINSESITNLSENIIYLHKLGFKITASIAHGVKWDIENNKIQFANELKKICDFYINNPTITPCSLFDMFLPIIPYKLEQTKWCGCGTHMVAVDIDGKEYPCQSFLPSSMTAEEKWEEIDFSIPEVFSDKKCTTCLIKNICPTCYGINIVREGFISKRDNNLCELYKILALANSFLLGTQIERKQITFESTKKLFDTINSIKLIQNEFSIFNN